MNANAVKCEKAKSTEGPWDTNGALVFAKSKNGLATLIAETVVCDNVSDEQRKANARLIAAAPKLLEALKLLNEDMECYCKYGSSVLMGRDKCAICIANEAIAKAEGGAQ